MKRLRLVGDIHGDVEEYLKIVKDSEQSIQVGDYGMGFEDFGDVPKEHRFIRGNHDSPWHCRKNSNWIPDGSIETIGEHLFMFCGGARSIDQHYRVEGVSWWRDEELSQKDLMVVADNFEKYQPEIMITHDAPEGITNMLYRKFVEEVPPITRVAFDWMFSKHKPKLWFHGHWHQSRDVTIEGCRFITLDINEYCDLDLKTLEIVERGFK